jgi:transposase
MPKPYSIDLRGRVIEDVESGASRREAAESYGLSPSVVVIWMQRFEETGSVAAKPSGGSTSPLEKHADFLLALIAEQPDLTLDELVAAMRRRRIAGSRSAVWRFFARRNISFKKKLCTRRSRSARTSSAHAGAGCASKACLTQRGWCSSTKPARTPRWCGCVAALRGASDWSATRRMALGKQSPSWAACDDVE